MSAWPDESQRPAGIHVLERPTRRGRSRVTADDLARAVVTTGGSVVVSKLRGRPEFDRCLCLGGPRHRAE